MRRAAATAAALLVPLLLGAATTRPAEAEYGTVTGNLVQWEWATVPTSGTFQVTDLVVRDDGWMIVSTSTYADGYLHLIPPWGDHVDTTNRFGSQPLGFRQLELRRGRLYGLRQETQRDGDRPHNPGRLIELDASTGEVLADHGAWWFQDLAVDPQTDDLVLQAWGGFDPYRHELVRFDPDRGSQEVLVRDDDERADRALEVAYSPDGNVLYTANVTDVPVTIDVRSRDGAVQHSLVAGQVDSLSVGRPGSCFEGLLLLTRYDGSVWAMRTSPGSSPTPIAAGGRALAVSYAADDGRGNLATSRYADVTLVACPGFVPPKPPVRLPPALAAAAPAAAPGAPTAEAPPPGPPAAPPAPPGPPAAVAPPAPPAPAPAPIAPPSALGSAVQSAAAPSVGAADAPEEEHLTSLAASSHPGLVWSVGAVLAMCLAAYAVAAVPPPNPRLRTAESRRTRGSP